MSKRSARCLPATVALAALAGCGTVAWNRTKVQNAIRDVLTKQAGVQVQSVTCPSKAKIATGVVTYCDATLAGGDTVRFSATQTDAKGHVHVAPAEMIALEVQNKIQSALRQRGVTAAAKCPQHVPIAVGKTFVCVATDAQGRHARIGVTITDASAGFRMRVLGT
jgi:hypothetical protein